MYFFNPIKVTNEYIDRNIAPFAASEFESVVEELGDVQGPLAIKNIFDLKVGQLSQNDLEALHLIARAFHDPRNTLFKQQANDFTMTPTVRAIFCLFLLQYLQKHFQNLLEEKNILKLQLLAWIPNWTKHKADIVKKSLKIDHSDFNFKKYYSLVAGILIALVAFYFMAPNSQKKAAYIKMLILISFLITGLKIISDKIEDCFVKYHNAKKQKKNYGDAYFTITKLIKDISEKQFRSSSDIAEMIKNNCQDHELGDYMLSEMTKPALG